MRFKVSEHDLKSHANQLRNCLSFEKGGQHFFEVCPGDSRQLLVVMNSSWVTREVKSDRDITENAMLLHTRLGRHSVWMSYSESWEVKNKFVDFNNAAFRIYLCPEVPNGEGGFKPGEAQQLLRVEWEGRNIRDGEKWIFPAQGAGHPHVQFDRCAVFAGTSDKLLSQVGDFESIGASATEFKEQQTFSELSWFHKLHFPMHAPWHEKPYKEEDINTIPHAIQPKSLDELEAWITSVALYVKKQFQLYS